MPSRKLAPLFLVSISVLLLSPAAISAPEPQAGDAAQAVSLYDAGDYEGARKILERLDAEGRSTGPQLYRLSYCLGRAQQRDRQREAADRALLKLSEEFEGEPDLEVAFYLVNALRNSRRAEEAKEIAGKATGRIEAGDWPKPKSGLDRFRAGKLYADQDRTAKALLWYGKALKKLEKEPEKYPSYIAWARRFQGNSAYAEEQYEDAEEAFSAMLAVVDGTPGDLDRLAVIRARLKRYAGAAEAWKQAEKLDPVRGNRSRYCGHVARMAQELGTLPENTPSGEPYAGLGREELEAIMKEKAQVVKDARAEIDAATAAEQSPDPARLAELQQKVDSAKPVFTAACLEYALRDFPIRETAFFGGYAPLIFHREPWRLASE
jgi:tetratricopeptide (TPR) repeat protein